MKAEVLIPILISLGLLITNIISVLVAIHYKRRDYRTNIDDNIILNDKITVFTTRNKMLEYLHSMYTKALPGDIIWGQSVSGNIYGDVNAEIVSAATRGVKFEMIFNSDIDKITNSKKELKELFTILNATIKLKDDNDIRIQGLSTKEVVVAFPTNRRYIAVLIKDEPVVSVLRNWFLSRFQSDYNKWGGIYYGKYIFKPSKTIET